VGAAEHILGLVQGAKGIALLEKAVEKLAASPGRLDEAWTLVDLGAALRRSGKRREARDPLRKGLEAARRCGATALVERAHAELVTAGARPRRLMFSGAESLTPSERRVAAMAADGQSNRDIAQALFVTVKTVETHLGRAYNKLGISSRKEIAAALAEPIETP
jgi:DNA-binding CsgD family transcriptional regulator